MCLMSAHIYKYTLERTHTRTRALIHAHTHMLTHIIPLSLSTLSPPWYTHTNLLNCSLSWVAQGRERQGSC